MDFKPSNRKREQKTSLFFHEVSNLIRTLALDEPDLIKVFVTRVTLSNDYGICFVYFSTYTDKAEFDKALPILKMYKSSLRHALAQIIQARYATNLVFLYDEQKEKERKINALLDEAVKDLPEE
ncbi:MAG: Ribosome-binding factor A [candidate division TM6 bacterium GW2011_GWF2_28_16]|jgi:ribosome-binding factor A|nr:MAG: Ribosome-binding factor A [candidate division TM6 bacterium GW2011_GWF2_28_16]